MRDRDLRASLAAFGAQLPALEYDGATIDGRKRELICAELALELPRRVLHSLADACGALWPTHPRRALELALSEGPKPVLELARLCGATTSAVALELQAAKPKKSHKRKSDPTQPARAREARGGKAKMLTVWIEPEFHYYVKACAKHLRTNISELTRDALWRRIAVTVPRAPLHPPSPRPRRRAG